MITYRGPVISIHFDANELSANSTIIQLPDGYTYERVLILIANNITAINPFVSIRAGSVITFPVVNSKSPSTLSLYIADISKEAEIRLTIEKFGQIPDNYYFDKAFEPILVTGEDGNEYNVIPSDQFK